MLSRLGAWVNDVYSCHTETLDAPELAEAPEASTEVEEERDDTEFVRDKIAAAFELVTYYQNYKEVEVADLIDPKRRKALARKAKRLGNWLKHLGQHLEWGAP